jgi:hypothetical protein
VLGLLVAAAMIKVGWGMLFRRNQAEKNKYEFDNAFPK